MMGLDGQKMSKSYGNTISLRENPSVVEDKIKTMPTDPARIRLTDAGDPEKCPVWNLHQVYCEDSVKKWVVDGWTNAKIGCLDCKKPLIDAVMKEGIEVRYVFFPRSGPDTESWYKAQEVWCSADQLQAITLAKEGKSLNSQMCSNDPVQQHYDLGRMFNVQGTPTMVTDAGEVIVGYLSAADLKDRLDGK